MKIKFSFAFLLVFMLTSLFSHASTTTKLEISSDANGVVYLDWDKPAVFENGDYYIVEVTLTESNNP